MGKPNFFNDVYFTCVRLAVSDKVGKSWVGSGFIYTTPAASVSTKSRVFVITNRHVLPNAECALVFKLHRRLSSTGMCSMDCIEIRPKQLCGLYYSHPLPDVDLACVEITDLVDDSNCVFYKSIDSSFIPTFSEEQLLSGIEVFFVGYPDDRYDAVNNLPILRTGCIASIPKVDFNGMSAFLIDAQVFGGSSGSPVFCSLDGRFKLMGVVTQVMIRNQRLQAVDVVRVESVQQVLGLGIVIKTTKVSELIDYALSLGHESH